MSGVKKEVEEVPLPDPRCGRSRESDLGGIVLTEFRMPPHFELGFHRHGSAALFVWLQGRLEVDLGREAWMLSRPGEVLVMPAGLEHREHGGPDGGRCLMIQGTPDSPVRDEMTEVVQTGRGGVVGPLDTLPRTLEAALSGPLDVRRRLRARAVCLDLLAGFDDLHSRTGTFASPAWLRAATRWIDEHYLEEWSLSELSERFGVSPSHLTRCFREELGTSVGARIRKLRLEHAAKRLSTTDIPISDVASEAGFSDQSHLTRLFRRRYGTTPARYRRTASRG